MKTTTSNILSLLLFCLIAVPRSRGAESEIPVEIRREISKLELRLETSMGERGFSFDEYVTSLNSIGREYEGEVGFKLDTAERTLLALCDAVSDPDQAAKLEELKVWYGQPKGDQPFRILVEIWGETFETEEEYRAFEKRVMALVEDAKKKGGQLPQKGLTQHGQPVQVADLHKKHTDSAYLAAWHAYLLAPQCPEKRYTGRRPLKAIQKIGSEESIPYLEMAFRLAPMAIDPKHSGSRKDKVKDAAYCLYAISLTPGDEAVEAMLRCNRYATARGFNGKSEISRLVVRRLSSLDSYTEAHPQTSPNGPTDENWKIYKPLIEARLKAKTDETPKVDIAILEAALEAMPIDC